MSHVISRPIESLIHPLAHEGDPKPPADGVIARTDIVIVGSGYGASVAAMKLAGLARDDGTAVEVLVLERGHEHSVGEFPTDLGELPGHVRVRGASDAHPTGNPDALFDLRRGDDLDVLVGNGLGGGSLINANVAARPDPMVFERWPAKYRNGLDAAFARVEDLLRDRRRPFPVDVPKFGAFEATAGDCAWAAGVKIAPITVSHRDPSDDEPGADDTRSNALGIAQPSCTNCGNCVTGCNVGAKNTLMMNLIPLAHARGARFFTGANVVRVLPGAEEGAARWRLEIQPTRSIKTPLERERFVIEARYVILAAGTLGSTEILMRSAETQEGFDLSPRLGTRFSTNGDGLAFTYGQNRAVNAIGRREYLQDKGEGPGPTITAIVQGRLEDGSPFTFEDGAIPAALTKVFGEALTTGAQLGRIGRNGLPAYFDAKRVDPLAFDPDALQHGQVFLMMTDDGARRSLSLEGRPDARDSAHWCVIPSALEADESKRADATLDALDRLLAARDLGAAFDGGQFVANPAFRLFPRDAAAAFGGRMPGRRNVSVHPLGGCPMGEDVSTGVVDPDGEVFDPRGDRHEGLFVMDGAIVPGAVATNPFLTIAAVAWSCCDVLLERVERTEAWRVPVDRRDAVARTPDGLLPDPRIRLTPPLGPRAEPKLVIREQLVGELTGRVGAAERAHIERVLPGASRLFDRDGLVIRLETEPVDVHGRFASESPERLSIAARAKLHVNPESHEDARKRPGHGAPRSLRELPANLEGRAKLTLMALDRPKGSGRLRALSAWATYVRRRGMPALGGGGSGGLLASIAGFARKLKGTFNVAAMHGRYRAFDYRIEFGDESAPVLVLEGRKQIRYAPRAERLFDALLHLPIDRATFACPGRAVTTTAHLRVDASYIFDEGLLQVDDCDDMTESAMAAFSFIAWFARCILEAGFWEFAAPAYPAQRTRPDPTPPPIRPTAFRKVEPVRVPLPVPAHLEHEAGREHLLPLDLHRYPQVGGGGKPVLLIHGLAQGSSIFTTPHMDHNMASYLWKRGYDVWVFDHRLSNRFDEREVPYGGWGIDAIGRLDVPAAVRHVHAVTKSKVSIFAHCVGAIGVEIALLEGLLRQPVERPDGFVVQQDLVAAVCVNAIHPWIVPSPANLARSKLGTFVRARLPDDLLDPVLEPADEVSAAKTLFDRLASGVARIGERGGRGFGKERDDAGHGWPTRGDRGTCDRMTLLYGRMWRHGNLERSVHENWAELVGRAPARVYQQLYYMLDRERILDDHGENTYLTETKLIRHWSRVPTFFLHGNLSDVFNPLSATRSAVRLQAVLGRGRCDNQRPLVRLARIDGFGHMDPIIGKRAHKESFPRIEHFFALAAGTATEKPGLFDAVESRDDTRPRRRRAPNLASAVRSAWVDGDEIVVRHWIEQNRFGSTPPQRVEIQGHGSTTWYGGRGNQPLFHVEPDEPWYAWFDERTKPSQARYEARRPAQRRPGTDPSAPDLFFVPESRFSSMTDEEGYFRDGATPANGMAGREPHYYRRLAARQRGDAEASERFDFIVGSCRYPGTPFEADLADDVFAGMHACIEADGADMAFFVGDQIYADAYNDVFDGTTGRERYHDRYKAAFTSPHMARVLRSLPVHFAIDDHEIVDNWSGSATQGGPGRAREVFGPQAITYGRITDEEVDVALRAARLHMSSGREVHPVGDAGRPARRSLWYPLDHDREVAFPCFVLDTRGERELRAIERYDGTTPRPQMMRPGAGGQLEAFEQWLELAGADRPDAPKFVFAGQVLAPLRRSYVTHPHVFRSHDGFVGYPDTLARIIEKIVERRIRNVIFVGGDHHMSSVARLTLRAEGDEVTAWQIVSSGLYSPMPFTNARPGEYDWRSPQPVEVRDAGRIGFAYTGEWITDARSHFLRIEVAREPGDGARLWQVQVKAYDPDGQSIRRPQARFDEVADDTRIVLA